MENQKLKSYWKQNLLYLTILLSVWAIISYGCGVVWAEQLNQYHWRGFKLGFWFAQQGSIYGFLAIIFIYVWLMNKLDKKYDLQED